MRVLTPTLSPTLATESATVRLFFLSALLCSVNKAACDFAHARPIMHCIHLVYMTSTGEITYKNELEQNWRSIYRTVRDRSTTMYVSTNMYRAKHNTGHNQDWLQDVELSYKSVY